MSDLAQFQAAKFFEGAIFSGWAPISGACGQRNAKLFDLLQRHISTTIKRYIAEHAGKRPHEIKNGDNIAAHSPRRDMFEIRNNEQQQTNSDEQEQVRPRLRDNETHLCGNIVHLVRLRGKMNIIGKEHAAAIAVELQFLDPFGESTKMVEEPVLDYARETQEMKAAVDHHPIDDRADNAEHAENSEHFPRQPAQVNGAAQENRNIDRHHGDAQQRLSDVQHVFGERDHEPRRADFFQPAKGHVEDFVHEVVAKLRDDLLREACERELGQETGNDLADHEADKNNDEYLARSGWVIEHAIDHAE